MLTAGFSLYEQYVLRALHGEEDISMRKMPLLLYENHVN